MNILHTALGLIVLLEYQTINSIDKNGTGLLTLKMNEMEIQKNFSWELDNSNRDFFLKT